MRECHTPMSFPTEKLSLPDGRAEGLVEYAGGALLKKRKERRHREKKEKS